MQRIFHTPEGVRDIYGSECSRKQDLQARIHKVFRSYGYKDIETPAFEYFEVFSNEVGTIPSRELYKFFDQEGNTLALRPDITPSVSRACATYFNPDQEVVTLCYTGNTFINSHSMRGKMKESTQMGVERIGDATTAADAELLAMTAECLLASGLTEFQISVGQINYFRGLVQEAGLDEEEEAELRALISEKNTFGVENLLKGKNLPGQVQEAFEELPHLFGGADTLKRAKELAHNERSLKAVGRLEEIYELLKAYGYEKYVGFDFGMLSKYHYYTGIIFQAYTYGVGEALVKGGRYNQLLKHFGKDAPSTGFAIMVDQVLQALSRQKIELPAQEEDVIIVYKKEESAEAIRKAAALRKEGRNVVLRMEMEEKA